MFAQILGRFPVDNTVSTYASCVFPTTIGVTSRVGLIKGIIIRRIVKEPPRSMKVVTASNSRLKRRLNFRPNRQRHRAKSLTARMQKLKSEIRTGFNLNSTGPIPVCPFYFFSYTTTECSGSILTICLNISKAACGWNAGYDTALEEV